MANPLDILLTSGFDLIIQNGDFAIGDATLQNQQLLLLSAKGDFKEHPTVGVDIMGFINDDNVPDLMREVRLCFTQDGMTIKRADYENNKLAIEATY